MNRKVGIKGKNEFFDELERDWLAIDGGETAPEPVHRVYFESAEVLSRVITRTAALSFESPPRQRRANYSRIGGAAQARL